MPQRFLKPGITHSEKWDSVSWKAQSFYIRLITLVDDFGRFEANPSLLKSLAFPLRDDITSKDAENLCEEVEKSGLVKFYEVLGKKYLQMMNWSERTRSQSSKYPEYNDLCKFDSKALRNAAESCGILPSESKPSSKPSPSPCGEMDDEKETYSSSFEAFYSSYPKSSNKPKTYEEWVKVNPDKELCVHILYAVEAFKRTSQWGDKRGRFIPLAINFIKGRKWEEIPPKKPTKIHSIAELRARDEAEILAEYALKFQGGAK